MAIKGDDLYNKIKPIIDKKYTNTDTFLTELGDAISNYIVTNDSLEGAYVGFLPTTPPSLSPLEVAISCMEAVNKKPSTPTGNGWIPWLKKVLTSDITWNISDSMDPSHTFAPTLMKPIYSVTEAYFDTLGNLSDIHSAYGVWALLSDLIVICILSAIERITPISATGTDGSSGTITWIPIEIPTLTHNFKITVHYDASNTKLVQWLKNQGIDVDHAQGDIPIPLNDKAYQESVTIWLGVKALTKNCKFYKVQSDNTDILLANGTDI